MAAFAYLSEAIDVTLGSILNDAFHVITGNDAIVISDIEIPDQDNWMMRAALLVGIWFGIRTLIWGGDLIATDQDALNTWLTTWAEEGGNTYEADLHVLDHLSDVYMQWFSDQYAITGNHDMRIDKKTGGQVTMAMLLRHTPIQFSRYSYMYMWMPRKREWVYICHQFNYSKTSVKLAQDIWAVVTAPDGYDTLTGQRIENYDWYAHGPNKDKCHVLVTHTHVAQDGFSLDNNWRTIGLGCMRDDTHTKYKRARATKFPEWNQGFVMIKNGHFTSLTKHGTDWYDLLGDDLYTVLMGRSMLDCRTRSQ